MAGLPGRGMHLGIDPLSAMFLMFLVPQVAAGAIVSEWKNGSFWVFVLGMGLTLLSADVYALTLGFGVMGTAAWLLLRSANRAPVAAVLSGGMVNIALYIVIRYGFIVDGDAVAPWCGVILMLAGAALVLVGSLRAVLEVALKTVLARSMMAQVGMIAAGLGIALAARATDDPALASRALQAALLGALAQGLFQPLLLLGAGAVEATTGTTSLDWLGGLLRGMPRLGVLMLAGAAGMAMLPLGPGFAPEFLLLHAVIAAAGSGGLVGGAGYAALLGILGLGAGLSLAAAVRIIGIGFLGRPRTLRAAAAEEAPRPVLLGMGLLAICCLPLALTPGLVLLAMQPVLAQLLPGSLPQPLGYAPLSLALLLLGPAALAWWLLRRFAARGEREVAAWNGGFGKPPSWLPFGDPMTQPSATGFAAPVRRASAGVLPDWDGKYLPPSRRVPRSILRLARRARRVSIRQQLSIVFIALVAALLALGLRAG